MRNIWGFAVLCGLSAAMAAQQTAAHKPTTHLSHAQFPAGKDLATAVRALLADPAVSRAHWGIAVTALDGTPIFGLDEGKLFRPASTAKLFTTTAAMARLGPDDTVSTTLSFPRPDADGTVKGDLTVQGAGDASLSGVSFPYVATKPVKLDPLHAIDELVEQVKKTGAHHFTGNVIVSLSLNGYEPYPQGWGAEDLLWGYGAPVSELSLDDNQVQLTVTPAKPGDESAVAKLTPNIGYYAVTTDVSPIAAPQIEERPGADFTLLRVGRSLLLSGVDEEKKPYATEVSVDDPPAYFAQALLTELRSHGVKVDGTVSIGAVGVDGGKPSSATFDASDPDQFLADYKRPLTIGDGVIAKGAQPALEDGSVVTVTRPSVPLAEDVVYTLKESQNLHAELMLLRMGDRLQSASVNSNGDQTVDGTRSSAGARVIRQWAITSGVDKDDVTLFDGSGLSVKDVVTPRAEVQLLAFATKQPWFAQWKAALPVGGVDGTLASRFTAAPLKGHVFAKTGTLGESRALAGYLDCASGKQVVFSIMVDNHPPGSSADKAVMDKIVAAIAAAE